MVRKKLKEIGDKDRNRYQATVGRLGIKNNTFKGFPERTILLKDITCLLTNTIVTDHLWFTCGKTLQQLALKSGDLILFNARVGKYKKGYYRNKKDYTLKRPTKIEVTRIDRPLEEGEITSDTPPTLEELEEAREVAKIINHYTKHYDYCDADEYRF